MATQQVSIRPDAAVPSVPRDASDFPVSSIGNSLQMPPVNSLLLVATALVSAVHLLLSVPVQAESVATSDDSFAGRHPNSRFITTTPASTESADSQLSFLWRLLGISMEPVQSNTTPNPSNDPKTLPQGTDINDCITKWKAYYSKKKGPRDQIRCCLARRQCMCFEEVCKRKPDMHGCKGLGFNCHKQRDCRNVTVTDRQCVEFKDAGTREKSKFNWLWLLIALGILMILCICISIWCVYRKKFTGKDTKKDKKHAKYSFGQPNVESKVKWHGKKKGGSKRGESSSASKKSSRKSSKKSKKRSKKGAM